MNAMISFKRLLGLCALRTRRQSGMAAVLARLSLPLLALLSPAVEAQTTLTYTGALQTYTVPVGAGGVQIQAAGAGGGSGGNDLNGLGGTGGAGARATGTYYAAPGTVLNIYVGQGGRSGNTSQGTYNYTNAAGAGGLAGGAAGFAGGAGGQPGSGGYSGGGAGGGAASVVATVANVPLVIAGGGGGGQGAGWNVAGRAGLNAPATPIGALPGAAGAAGTTNLNDGGGGGGGGGGCPRGAGGAVLLDNSTSNNTLQAGGGSSCRDTSQVTSFVVTGAAGGAGGASTSTASVPTNGNSGGNGSVTITPLYPTLNLAKSQPSPTLAVGGNSVYTLAVTTTTSTPAYATRVLDQLPANLSYVSSSGTGWICTISANADGTLVTCNFSGTIAASGGTSALQITVLPTSNLSVTNRAVVDHAGGTNPPVPATCTAANTPSAGCAAPVTSAVSTTVSGTVYGDANHNASLDSGETGTGETGLFVKLTPSSGSACSGPATAAAAVAASTGAYSLAGIAQGNYCLVLDDNSNLADITPAVPANWIGTQNASGVIQLSVIGAPPSARNFGLFNGSRLSGTVFADTGIGSGGSANNGVKDGSEAGLASVIVNASATGMSGVSSSTAGDGSYTLWLPSSASGTVTIAPVVPGAYLSAGGLPGTTSTASGTYSRPNVTYTTPAVAGQTYTGVNFGLVPPNILAPHGTQMAQPGTVVFYAHTFKAGSGGQVTFSLANTATPSGLPWTQVLYKDTNCTGALDTAAVQITASLTVVADATLCLIVKQFVPAAAAIGAENATTLSAAFSYTGASPALSSTLTAMDVTTVGRPSEMTLSKRVSNVTQGGLAGLNVSAKPGETLQYTLAALNNGSESSSALTINDATPAFTTYLSATCPAALPASLTACSVSTQPALGASGNLQWTFTGSLTPSAQVEVTYKVLINQ